MVTFLRFPIEFLFDATKPTVLVHTNYISSSFKQIDQKLEFEMMFKIKSEGESYILGRPGHVVTDKFQNIYISDLGSMMIHKFSPTGEFIYSFGRRGRGPGEFLDMTLLHINENGLYVFDQNNLVVSQFSLEGDLIESFSMNNRIMLWPRGVFDHGNQEFIFVYKLPDGRYFQGEKSKHLFHIISDDFSEELASFGDYSKLNYTESPYFDHILQMNTGSTYYERSTNELFFIPHLYNGILYVYDVDGKSKIRNVKLNEEIQKESPFYIVGGRDRFNHPVISVSSNETIHGVNARISDGLFKTISGHFVHFYSELINEKITEDSEYNFHYQLFMEWDIDGGNPKKKLVSKYLLRNPIQPIVQWKDNKDNFFFINYDEDGNPSIEVKRLKVSN